MEGEQKSTFGDVELLKSEVLGTGAYGAVCKAKCGHLICAAKLLYPVLFQTVSTDPDREHRQPFRRFEQECQFLSQINHPNIVQYLGTYRDPDTNSPVLLMELMDENLTHFLESSPGDIPYHIQVSIAQDIAQALAFLHTTEIIHRDLSSNNVLLTGSHAKISDFGMLKFKKASSCDQISMTQCPGTMSYMSPEALNEPPVYTEKLDNFSFGVLLVQIATRKFPAPGDRFETVMIPSPRDLSCEVESKVPIPEVERRQAHIRLIVQEHPLLPIALECLKDKAVERPSSQQLCELLSELKCTTALDSSQDESAIESKANAVDRPPHDLDPDSTTVEENSMENQFCESNCVQQKSEDYTASNFTSEERSQQVPFESSESEPLQLVWDCQLEEQHPCITGESYALLGEKVYFHWNTLVYEFHTADYRWFLLPDHPFTNFSLVTVDNELTTVGGSYPKREEKSSNKLYSYIKGKWAKKYPPMPTQRNSCTVVYSNHTLIVAGGDKKVNLTTIEILNTKSKRWFKGHSLPFPTSCPSMAVCGEYVYLHAGYAPQEQKSSVIRCPLAVLGSSSQVSNPWERVAPLSVTDSSIVNIKGHILAVGGEDSKGDGTTEIMSYDAQANHWLVISKVSIPRARCLAIVLPNEKLMVVGGSMRDRVVELVAIQ